MSDVVSTPDQMLTGDIVPNNRTKTGGKITITAAEKKDDHGINQFSMSVSFNTQSNHSSLFFTLSKGAGRHLIPIFKSECQQHINKKNGYYWDMVLTNTDALADSDPEQMVHFTFYKFSNTGSHMKLTSF